MPTIEEIKEFLTRVSSSGTPHFGLTYDPRKKWDDYEAVTRDLGFQTWVGNMYRDSVNLLHAGGYTYPCALFEARGNQRNDVDSILATPLTTLNVWEPITEYHKAVVVLTEHQHRTTGDPKFAMTRFTEAPLKITCGVGSYFAALDTCDVLKLEAQMAWLESDGGIRSSANPLDSLPLRRRLQKRCDDPIRQGDGRCAAIAVSTLVCYLDDSGYRCLLHRRAGGRKLATDPDLFHVIPAAMFEPDPQDGTLPYSIHENILREYLEEMWNVKKREDEPHDREWYRRRRVPLEPDGDTVINVVEELDAMLKAGRASLYLTGIIVNLLNLRPEICTLLVMREPSWRDERLYKMPGHNWEYSEDAKKIEIAYSDEQLAQKYHDVLSPENIVVPGAAAFWLGVRLARELLVC